MRDSKQTDIIDGMNLKSEDKITTGQDGIVELLVDADKHILAREDTCFTIVSKGNEKTGKLLIELEYGSSLIEIENKLEDGATVEVSTPNATLSVRGTIFEVDYNKDANTTIAAVADGVVSVETYTESAEVLAGQMAIVKDDEIEVKDLPIAYSNATPFSVRYMSNLSYSDIYVKQLVGWSYKATEQNSSLADGYTNGSIEIGYWLMTKDEVNAVFDNSEHEGIQYYTNDDGSTIECAMYDYRDNPETGTMGYVYYKELENGEYLGIIVSDMGSGALVNTNISTYLPLTNNCYYSYNIPLGDKPINENGLADEAVSEVVTNESSERELVTESMEIVTADSSQKAVITYNAYFYQHEGATYILKQESMADFVVEYNCFNSFSGGGEIELYESTSSQDFYERIGEKTVERGTVLSEAYSVSVGGRSALVFKEYMGEEVIQNYVVMEEGDSLLVFNIYTGIIFEEGDTVIEELEAFFVDVEIVE